MEKADIQKSLIIFNCFVLSQSDVRVTHCSYAVLFQRKSSSSVQVAVSQGEEPMDSGLSMPTGFLAQHLERRWIFKKEQLWRAIKGFFQPSARTLEKMKRLRKLKAGWPLPSPPHLLGQFQVTALSGYKWEPLWLSKGMVWANQFHGQPNAPG